MQDKSVEGALLSRRFEEELVLPSYDTFCISNIPGTISSFLGVRAERVLPREPIASHVDTKGIGKVVLLVVDGLGYDTWSRHASDNGFLGETTEEGLVFPITSVFPSTTAAALTTLSTGLTPQEHGLPEWNVYIQNLDMIIATLPFSPMGQRGQDRLIGTANPAMLFSGTPLHHSLRAGGVETKALLSSHIASSAYTRMAMRGGEIVPYASLSDMAVKLAKNVSDPKEPAFVYAYWDGIDTIGHLYGPDSQEFGAETATFSGVLKHEFLKRVDKESADRTLLIVTADHGQLGVSPEETIYLNKLKSLKRSLMKGDRGRPILPTWSPRDVALFIDEGKLGYALDYLSKVLGEEAFVIETREAVERGFFGSGVPTRRFLERAGNLLVLPRGNKTVWYEFVRGKKFGLLGMHGGLTPTELLVPFAISNLGRLLGGRER